MRSDGGAPASGGCRWCHGRVSAPSPLHKDTSSSSLALLLSLSSMILEKVPRIESYIFLLTTIHLINRLVPRDSKFGVCGGLLGGGPW
jgi:hypothetical protein